MHISNLMSMVYELNIRPLPTGLPSIEVYPKRLVPANLSIVSLALASYNSTLKIVYECVICMSKIMKNTRSLNMILEIYVVNPQFTLFFRLQSPNETKGSKRVKGRVV